MSDPLFIDDGYTRDGYVAARPGLHGELKFTFRPMIFEEREELNRQIDAAPEGKTSKIGVMVLAKHVVSWGVSRELKPENIRKLHPSLFDSLYQIVLGIRASDKNPAGELGRSEQFEEGEAVKN